MAGTRKLPVPIALPSGRVRRGHLLPDLRLVQTGVDRVSSSFVCLPGGARHQYGMLAHVGLEVTVEDLLARWERDVGAVSDREAALVWLREFVAGLDRLKIGNLVEIQYVTGRGPELHKVHDAPPTEGIVPLPQ